MKALFIMPYNCDLIHAVSLPLGLISIGSYLKENGYEVRICDLSVSHINIEKVFDELIFKDGFSWYPGSGVSIVLECPGVDIYYYSVNEPTSEGKWWFYTSTVDGVTDIGIW